MTNPSILMPMLIAACFLLALDSTRAADRSFDENGALP